jgi:hypothetical protein
LVTGAGRTRAEVYGVGHRYPTTLKISLHLASHLVSMGAPLAITDEGRVHPREKLTA